jgi:hypothetical protein
MSLNQDDQRVVESVLRTDKVRAAELSFFSSLFHCNPQINMCCAARLHRSTGGEWESLRVGAVVACTDTSTNGVFSVKMVDLKTRQIVFEQEIYFGFKYQELAPFFHSFEVEDCVAGLCFTDEAEAKKFAGQVKSFTTQVEAIAKMNQVTASSAPPLIPVKDTKKSPPAVATSAARPRTSTKEEKKKKPGFFSKLLGREEKPEEEEFVLSGPSGFRHESHIGWDPTNGFDIRNIPPEWKALFKAAGVKKSDLQGEKFFGVFVVSRFVRCGHCAVCDEHGGGHAAAAAGRAASAAARERAARSAASRAGSRRADSRRSPAASAAQRSRSGAQFPRWPSASSAGSRRGASAAAAGTAPAARSWCAAAAARV